MSLGRNDPCSCGSGEKFKKCCGKLKSGMQTQSRYIGPNSTAQNRKTEGAVSENNKFDQLITLYNAARNQELESRSRLLLEQYPDSGFAWKMLSLSLLKQGKDALPALQEAARLLPDDVTVLYNLGNSLKRLGQLDQAVLIYRQVIQIKPDYMKAYANLGSIHYDMGRMNEAEGNYRQALLIDPDSAALHYNLGNVLHDTDILNEAEASYRKALRIKPDFAEAHNGLSMVLMKQGRFDEAEIILRQVLKVKPDYANAQCNLGACLTDQSRFAEAEACLRRALEIQPDFAEGHCNLGFVLKELCRFNEAITSMRIALGITSDNVDALIGLGQSFQALGMLEEAEASFQRALKIKPDYDYALAQCNLLFLYSYHALCAPHEYLAQARNWERNCLSEQERQVARSRTFNRTPLAGRRLKVGYVSGDYHDHAVSYFIEQLFANHDRARIELFAYSTQGQRDAVTDRLQAMAEHGVPVMGISDIEMLNQIESDEIDVLIDLSGYTSHNRLGVFARRAAPVQAHYLGYFASTGLTEMDYWIGDETLTPPETDSHFSEQVWRLPRVWVSYEGKADAPATNWQPDLNGTVWLGSFNNLGKLTPATLALWSRVLQALPEAKLLLKTKELADAGNRQRILNAMAGHGIAAERIELQDASTTPGWQEHMAYYDRLDIALDPVGAMGGGTTTCDALWMGVPVITLEGDRMASRMTASMLSAIGHPEWIARTEAEYIDNAVDLARDVERRKALRAGQREQMATSPLCDAKDLAMKLEDAYFGMFDRWANIPTVSVSDGWPIQ